MPPLSTPDAAEVRAGDATHYESVTLFLDRAAAVAPELRDRRRQPGRRWSSCAGRLDGIPLAIELAAVWLRTLSPAQILDRLEDRFRLLTSGRRAAPARQQALDADRRLELRPVLARRAAAVGPALGLLRRLRPRGRRGGLLPATGSRATTS